MSVRLRDYQREAIDDTRARWDAGATRVPIVMATGLGKTITFNVLIGEWLDANPGKRALVIAHTNELIEQAAKSARQVNPKRRVGIVKGALNNVMAEIVISSRQTLASEKRRNQLRNVGLIVIDECFPAGTMVGETRIEDLRPGDMVPSWDEVTGEYVARPVVATMRKRPNGMVRVSLDGGETFACTPNHPILTSEGWCPAGLLWRGASVVSFTHDGQAGKDARSREGRSGAREGGSEQTCQTDATVHVVRKAGEHAGRAETQVRQLEANGKGVRYGSLPSGMGQSGFLTENDSHEPCASSGYRRPDDVTQPDGSRVRAREDESDACGDRSQAARPGRKWETDARTSASDGATSWVADGSDCGAGGWGASVSLQVGYRAPDDESVRGDRRGIPLLAEPPRVRPASGRTPVASRVADVQVLESGSDGTYGGVCPDGYVYNIEVEGTHTYLIGHGVVAHNCHHAVSTNTYGKILDHFNAFGHCLHCKGGGCAECNSVGEWAPDVKVLGVTATLARSDKAKLSTVWEDCTFSRDIMFGIKRGYLLDIKGERVIVDDLNMRNVSMRGGDFSESALADELERSFAIETIAKEYARVASDRKGIAFWPLVATAEHAARAFNEAGIPSAVVHGALPAPERRQVLADLRSGKVQVVHNAMVLTEGFDDPTVECVVIGRPTKSAPLYIQMVGRALRPDLTIAPSDRRPALVIDVTGASEGNDLRSLIDLSPERPLGQAYGEHPDATLSELEEFFASEIESELDEQRAGASWSFESEEYAGPVTTKAFDPLGRGKVWGKTAGGTYYTKSSVVSKADSFTFLVDSSQGDPGTYDIVQCSVAVTFDPRTGAVAPTWARGTEHVGLHLDMALMYGEELAGDAFNARKAAWRNRPPSGAMKRKARSLGVNPDDMTSGEVGEAIDAALAARTIDPLIARVRASVQ